MLVCSSIAKSCVKLPLHVSGADPAGRVQGVRTPPPHHPEMTCGFLIQLVFCQKKNYVVYWC